MNLDLVARQPQDLLRQWSFLHSVSHVAWHKAAFIALWEAQSQVSSIAYIALVAFQGIWVALGVMLVWSLVATVCFWGARERGYPNIISCSAPPRRSGFHLAWFAISAVGRAFLAGVQAFAFARCSNFLIKEKLGCSRGRRLARLSVLGFGLVMFGVTTAEHLLRTAGYSGRKLLRLSLVGPFLNVPYRVLLSAAVVTLFTDVLGLVKL